MDETIDTGDGTGAEPREAPRANGAAGGEGTPSWLDSLSEAQRARAESQGWASQDDLFTANEQLIGLKGVPADRLLRLPEDLGDSEQMAEVYGRLGRPGTAEEYDFGELSEQMGETELLSGFRSKAHEMGLSNAQAAGLAGWYQEQLTAHLEAEAANPEGSPEEIAAQVDTKLREQFGNATALRKEEARIAARELFPGEEGKGTLEAIEAALSGGAGGDVDGAVALITLMAKVHGTLAEGGGPAPGSAGGFNVMSPAEALAEIDRFHADPNVQDALNDKMHPDHKKVIARKSELFRQAYPS